RRHTGDTAINYIHRFILQKAKSLLSAGKTITEVAYDLGFAYPQHLSRLFKRKEGLSPSEYVNRIQ
ncbi:MAG: helix-turn-helix domain-containing protein, partial [Parabacteroides sp.]|nr:helix-turn-helix domain-containing protein [Parabacteroides sp.]